MSSRFFSLVLLNHSVPFDSNALATKLAEYLKAIGSSFHQIQNAKDPDQVLFEVGGVKISIKMEINAVPASVLDTAVKFSLAWPDAKKTVSAHKAHLIIGCLELPSDHEQALHFAVMNSLVTAAVLEVLNGAGVYWSTAQLLIEPETFRKAAHSILSKQLPVEDWINLFWIKGQLERKPAVGCVTAGAIAFLGMEIEFLPAPLSPAELAQRIFGIFRYLLMNGAVLKDGDTLGQSASELIRVHFREQGLHFQGRVLQLSFEGNETPRPKQTLPGLSGKPNRATTTGNGRSRQPFGKRGR